MSGRHIFENNAPVNSSAIAEISSWEGDQRINPLSMFLKALKTPANDEDSPIEKYAKRINSTNSAGQLSHSSHNSDYIFLYDLVRAYLETSRGTMGSDDQRHQFHQMLCELLYSRECMDVAAMAFFATLDDKLLTSEMHEQINQHIKRRMSSSRYLDSEKRLDDVYKKFISDAYHHKRYPKNEAISVLDVDRFACRWLSQSRQMRPAFAFHWCISNLDQISNDVLSETFAIHGIKCRLRFRKGYALSNGETWTSMWLHNVSTGSKVVTAKFALVISNVAYPTICFVEAIKPSAGIRPSQGVGVKLFVPVSDLIKCTNGNAHPVIQYNSIRLTQMVGAGMEKQPETKDIRLRYMREALQMADEAYTAQEVPVGCVFVYNDQIVGRGRNETNEAKNGTRHAELVAIDRMLSGGFDIKQFEKTDLYVTVEPCIMCASALRQIGIGRVFYGCANDRFGGCESVMRVNERDDLDGTMYMAENGYYKDEAILMLRKFYIRENVAAPQPRKKANRVLKTSDLDIQ
ncbi:tRNA(adenine34) deaminase [Coemansia erecta]|nr:tRNA(adenine34) deaminase [Coemansia erecta]